jgi:hypothetical protein
MYCEERHSNPLNSIDRRVSQRIETLWMGCGRSGCAPSLTRVWCNHMGHSIPYQISYQISYSVARRRKVVDRANELGFHLQCPVCVAFDPRDVKWQCERFHGRGSEGSVTFSGESDTTRRVLRKRKSGASRTPSSEHSSLELERQNPSPERQNRCAWRRQG